MTIFLMIINKILIQVPAINFQKTNNFVYFYLGKFGIKIEKISVRFVSEIPYRWTVSMLVSQVSGANVIVLRRKKLCGGGVYSNR